MNQNRINLNFLLLFVVPLIGRGYADIIPQTGSFSYNQPITTIEHNGARLPISLTYSSGIKVNQRSSWVGLGFDLTTPYIERHAVGSADEKSGQHQYDLTLENPQGCNRHLADYIDENRIWDRLLKVDGTGHMKSSGCPPLLSCGADEPASACYKDHNYTAQQDVYMLRAPFGSGRIVFVPTETIWNRDPSQCGIEGIASRLPDPSKPLVPVLQNYQPLKIEYELSAPNNDEEPDIVSWTVTAADGVKYIFDAVVFRLNYEPDGNGEAVRRTSSQLSAVYKDGWLEYVEGADHHVNQEHAWRWYLTQIESPSGGNIQITYSTSQAAVQLRDLYGKLLDYDEDRNEEETGRNRMEAAPMMGLTRNTINDIRYISGAYYDDEFYFYPIYPSQIKAGNRTVDFHFSKEICTDVNVQGDKCLEEIVIRETAEGVPSTEIQRTRFTYDPDGHSLGHPYAKSTQKGRLMLTAIETITPDGAANTVSSQFGYHSNPVFDRAPEPNLEGQILQQIPSGFFKHDFYGYYSSVDMRTLAKPYIPPEGQSTIESAAWSVSSITAGNGLIKEITYEPNEFNTLSTGEKTPKMYGPGVRVKKSMSITNTDTLATSYLYSGGYSAHNHALTRFSEGPQPEGHIGEFYLLLNWRGLADLKHVLLLMNAGIMYQKCAVVQPEGVRELEFLSHRDILATHDGQGKTSLKDPEYGSASFSHLRGLIKRVRVMSSDATSLISDQVRVYSVNHDRFTYTQPSFEADPRGFECSDGAVSIDPGSAPSFPSFDIGNLPRTIHVGDIRLRSEDIGTEGVNEKTLIQYDIPSLLNEDNRLHYYTNDANITTESIEVNGTDYDWSFVLNTGSQKPSLNTSDYLSFVAAGEANIQLHGIPIEAVYETNGKWRVHTAATVTHTVKPDPQTLENGKWFKTTFTGLPLAHITIFPEGVQRSEKATYACQVYPELGAASGGLHILTEKFSKEVTYQKPSLNNGKDFVIKANGTIWGTFNDKWLPSSSHHWVSDLDERGIPLREYQVLNPNATKTEGWEAIQRVQERTTENRISEYKDNRGISTSKIYRHDLPYSGAVATIKNAKQDECAVYTGNFALRAMAPATARARWTMPTGAVLTSPPLKGLGQRAIHVTDDTGPSVILEGVKHQSDYVISCWLYSATSEPIRLSVRRISGATEDVENLDRQFELPVGTWKYVEHFVSSDFLTDIDDTKKLKIGFEHVSDASHLDCYLNDFRVYPKGALVTTRYYKEGNPEPITSVGPDGNAGFTEYDHLGRVTSSGVITSSGRKYLTEKSYHNWGDCQTEEHIKISTPMGHRKAYDTGDTCHVRWLTNPTMDLSQGVDLHYSTDNGASWNPIIEGIAGKAGVAGDYAWVLQRDAIGENCKIRIRNSADHSKEVTNRGTFMVRSAVPAEPAPVKPENGSTNISPEKVMLEWSSSGPSVKYDVYLSGTNPPLSRVSANISADSYEVKDLFLNSKYYWSVVAFTSGGDTTWSEVSSFTTQESGLPTALQVAPEAGDACVQTVSPTFIWQAFNGAAGAQYRIHVWPKNQSEPATPSYIYTVNTASNGNEYEYTFSEAFNDNTIYCWRIKPSFGTGSLVYGPQTPATAFRIDAQKTAPTKPIVSIRYGGHYPENDAIISWSGGDCDDGDNVYYQILFSVSPATLQQTDLNSNCNYDVFDYKSDVIKGARSISIYQLTDTEPGPERDGDLRLYERGSCFFEGGYTRSKEIRYHDFGRLGLNLAIYIKAIHHCTGLATMSDKAYLEAQVDPIW